MSQVSQDIINDTVWAAPEQTEKGAKAAVPSQFSTVLARERSMKIAADGNPLEGTSLLPPAIALSEPRVSAIWIRFVRVAQVRAIFRLLEEHIHYQQPLAYVEWFTPFVARDQTIGMYAVSPSTSYHCCRASIIPISCIIRTCHLIPAWGSHADPTWTSNCKQCT